MTTLERLERWRDAGLITEVQYDTIRPLVLKERVSVYVELHALLYIGVISLVAGLAWTAQTYGERVGDAVIVSGLSALLAACLYYCFSRARPFSVDEVESPSLIFDYDLYLGCLTLGVEIAYIENRFHLLGTAWDHYLLLSAVSFFILAYRFDNRFVLSLALSSLGGWFGLRFTRFGFLSPDSIRINAIAYGFLIASGGTWLWRTGIKKHFLQTYLHIAINVVSVALLTGIGWNPSGWLYLAILLALCAAAGSLGYKSGRFVFVVYAIAYAYIGISYQVISQLTSTSNVLLYLVVTGIAVIAAIIHLAREAAEK